LVRLGCKNTLVCMLLSYRLIVIQLERCNERYGRRAERRLGNLKPSVRNLLSVTDSTVLRRSQAFQQTFQTYTLTYKIKFRQMFHFSASNEPIAVK